MAEGRAREVGEVAERCERAAEPGVGVGKPAQAAASRRQRQPGGEQGRPARSRQATYSLVNPLQRISRSAGDPEMHIKNQISNQRLPSTSVHEKVF
jgi:hypothetical protein